MAALAPEGPEMLGTRPTGQRPDPVQRPPAEARQRRAEQPADGRPDLRSSAHGAPLLEMT